MIERFYSYLKNERRLSKHTLVAYKNDLKQFSYFLSKLEIGVLEVKDVEVRSWLVEMLEEGISQRSVNRKLSAVKSFYRFLTQQGKMESSPVQNIKLLKTAKRNPSFVRNDEMNKLLDDSFFDSSFNGQRDKLIIYILYYTGIRLSELINLKVSDVANDTIKVIGKRNKERVVPISKKLLSLINEYRALKAKESFIEMNNSFLLVTDKGDKLYEKFVFRKVKQYLSLVTTQKNKSPHVLRHTFATQMLNAGADLNAIKELLGHSDLSATQVYTHNSFEKLKGIYKQAHPRSEK